MRVCQHYLKTPTLLAMWCFKGIKPERQCHAFTLKSGWRIILIERQNPSFLTMFRELFPSAPIFGKNGTVLWGKDGYDPLWASGRKMAKNGLDQVAYAGLVFNIVDHLYNRHIGGIEHDRIVCRAQRRYGPILIPLVTFNDIR